MKTCPTCGKSTDNPKFCSKSCAATANNRKHKKRPPQGTCARCSQPIKAAKTFCKKCWAQKRAESESLTIGEFRHRLVLRGKHPSWMHAQIRNMARVQHADLRTKPCARCSYSLHVELAHIQAITSFPDDTPISVVNARTNVMQLCPNCHWEADHGIFQLVPPKGFEPSLDPG